jgi:hypothetical protein
LGLKRLFERHCELVIIGSDLEQQRALRGIRHAFRRGEQLFGVLPVEPGLEMFVAQWSLAAVIVFVNAATLACVPSLRIQPMLVPTMET